MKYAGILKNDFAAAPGVCTSFFTQGCPHHCKGCQNPETWDFNGGKEFSNETINELKNSLIANGIKRDLCILGGEPLCQENEFLTYVVIKEIKDWNPEIKVYIWTGYTYDELKTIRNSKRIQDILSMTYCLIDGPFILEERDVTLPMRGSKNQKIYYL